MGPGAGVAIILSPPNDDGRSKNKHLLILSYDQPGVKLTIKCVN
jgi:hypothetical protein